MSLQEFVAKVNQTGDDELRIMSDESIDPDLKVIPSGVNNIDAALGIGGVPRGRITEIFGKTGSGKTTLALHFALEAQKLGFGVGFVDAENALDIRRVEKMGIDKDQVVLSQPMSAEKGLSSVEAMVSSGDIKLIIVDSVAALIPQGEVDKEIGDSVMGLHARLMSQAMRKLAHPVAKKEVAVVFINQTRAIIGGFGYGPQSTTTGGVALPYYASMRLEMKRIGSTKDSSQKIIAGKFRMTTVKNKLAVAYKEAEFSIDESGIDIAGILLEEAIKKGVLVVAGSWVRMGKESIGQGRVAVTQMIKEDPKLRERIQKAIAQNK
jgi:recombination protein RecA